MRLDDSLVQGSDDAAAQIAAKRAIFSPLYTRLYPGSGLSSQVYTWRGGMERALRVDLQQERTDGA